MEKMLARHPCYFLPNLVFLATHYARLVLWICLHLEVRIRQNDHKCRVACPLSHTTLDLFFNPVYTARRKSNEIIFGWLYSSLITIINTASGFSELYD